MASKLELPKTCPNCEAVLKFSSAFTNEHDGTHCSSCGILLKRSLVYYPPKLTKFRGFNNKVKEN